MPDEDIKRIRVQLPEETIQLSPTETEPVELGDDRDFEEAEPVTEPEPQLELTEQGRELVGDIASGEKEKPKNELSDLFEVPQDTDNDMYIDDLFEVDEDDFEYEEEDLSDITRVDRGDIMGKAPRSRPKPVPRYRRPYTPPPVMGGLR